MKGQVINVPFLHGQSLESLYDELVEHGIPIVRQQQGSKYKRILEKVSSKNGDGNETEFQLETDKSKVIVNLDNSKRPRILEENRKNSFPPLPLELQDLGPPYPSIIETDKGKILAFFHGTYTFSNFAISQGGFELDGRAWCCTEQFYCFQKVLPDYKLAEQIYQNKFKPGLMKRMACFYNRPNADINSWTPKLKEGIMWRALRAKFTQNLGAKQMLLSTGEGIIVEGSPDYHWGVGLNMHDQTEEMAITRNWRGRNTLGRMLMELRKRLRNDEPLDNPWNGEYDYAEPVLPGDKNKHEDEKEGSTVTDSQDFSEAANVTKISLDSIDQEIEKHFYVALEPKESINQKLRICQLIEDKLEQSEFQAKILIFGSTLSKISTICSDLDIYICQTNREEFDRAEKLFRIRAILRDMKEKLGILATEVRDKALVPCLILKLQNGIRVDIRYGDETHMSGYYNSLWLKVVSECSDEFRILRFAFKNWAQNFNLNDPTKGSFNSFCLSLIVATFLEEKEIIPNFFEKFPQIYKQKEILEFLNNKFHCTIAQAAKKPKSHRVVTLLIELFKYLDEYSNFSNKLSVREGKSVTRNHDQQNGYIYVEEPFTATNAGKSVQKHGWENFLNALNETMQTIEEKNWVEFEQVIGIHPKKKPKIVVPPLAGEKAFRAIRLDSDESDEDPISVLRSQCKISENMKDFLERTDDEQQSTASRASSIIGESSGQKREALAPQHQVPIQQRLSIQGAGRQRGVSEYWRTPQSTRGKSSQRGRNIMENTHEMRRGSYRGPLRGGRSARSFYNSALYFNLTIMTILSLLTYTNGQKPMICHNNAETRFAQLTQDHEICNNLNSFFEEKPKTIELELFRPDRKEFKFSGYQCSKVHHEIVYWTNILNDPFEKGKQTFEEISKEECWEMVRNRESKYGILFGNRQGTMTTGHKLEFEHTYWSIGADKVEAHNCILRNSTLYSLPEEETILSPAFDLHYCKYSDGACRLKESIIVWEVEDLEGPDAAIISSHRCVYKHFDKRKGSLYKTQWLSDPPDYSITFSENPKREKSCFNDLTISDQGFAILTTDYRRLKSEIAIRNKRTPQNPIEEGEVHTPQLAAELQARAAFADKEMAKAFFAYSKAICEQMSFHAKKDLTQLNPTLLIREMLKNNEVEGKWVSKNIIEYWPCTTISHFVFRPEAGKCFGNIPINITILKDQEPLAAFLDPITHIVHPSSNIVPCVDASFTAIQLNETLIKIDQITGETYPVKTVEIISLQNKRWKGFIPETEIQKFHNLVITNLSHSQVEMLNMLKDYRTSQTRTGIWAVTSPRVGGAASADTAEFSPIELLFGSITGEWIWKWITRITIVIIILKTIFQTYIWGDGLRIRRIIKRQEEKGRKLENQGIRFFLQNPKSNQIPIQEEHQHSTRRRRHSTALDTTTVDMAHSTGQRETNEYTKSI